MPTTPSRAASASRCDGRRCSAGRRPSTTSRSPSRSGASSTRRRRPSWWRCGDRCSRVSATSAHHYAEARAHRRRRARGDAAQDPPAGAGRVPGRAGASCSALERRGTATSPSTSRSSVAASPGCRRRASWRRRAATSSCWSRRSSSRTTRPGGRRPCSSRATDHPRSGRSRRPAGPTTTLLPTASARHRCSQPRSALWVAPSEQVHDLDALVAEVGDTAADHPGGRLRALLRRCGPTGVAARGARAGRRRHRRARPAPGLRPRPGQAAGGIIGDPGRSRRWRASGRPGWRVGWPGGRGARPARWCSPQARGATSWRRWPAPSRSACGRCGGPSRCAGSAERPLWTRTGRWSATPPTPGTSSRKARTCWCRPADETPSPPCDARPDEADVALGIERVNEATTLGLRSVVSAWAGLRTFAPDRVPVVGEDPRLSGPVLAGRAGRLRHPDRAGHGPLPRRTGHRHGSAGRRGGARGHRGTALPGPLPSVILPWCRSSPLAAAPAGDLVGI